MVCPGDAFISRQIIPLIAEDASAPKRIHVVIKRHGKTAPCVKKRLAVQKRVSLVIIIVASGGWNSKGNVGGLSLLVAIRKIAEQLLRSNYTIACKNCVRAKTREFARMRKFYKTRQQGQSRSYKMLSTFHVKSFVKVC